MGHEARPLPIDVDVVGVIEHVRGQSPRRPQVHLEGVDPAVTVGTEELEVKEPSADVEGPRRPPPRLLQVRRDLPEGMVEEVGVLVDRLHDPLAEGVRGEEDEVSVAVGQPVEGEDASPG